MCAVETTVTTGPAVSQDKIPNDNHPLVGEGGTLPDLNLLQQNARRASTLLKAMSNENRLLILCQLVTGEKSVSELEKIIGLSQSALSQHLALLRRDKIVTTRRDSQTIFYSLAGADAQAVIQTLYGLYCPSPPSSAD